jgi:predicted dehydrogenase
MIDLLLVGNGKWGSKYVSTLSDFEDVKLQIADRTNWKKLIDTNPNGVIICTPPDSHVEISAYSLERNLPVMIEKPLSLSLLEAKTLKQFTAPILVNHTDLFTEGYETIKKKVKDSCIISIVSNGYNKSPNRTYSSLWDYGPHDLAMILDLLDEYPKNISIKEQSKNDGYLYMLEMEFDNCKTISKIGNGGDRKHRDISVIYDINRKVHYDDLERSVNDFPPLTNALGVFMDAINGKSDSRLGLDLALKITQILEECHNKLALN